MDSVNSKIQPKNEPVLNRYTSLPVLIDMLSRKALTLVSPASWADRNDFCYLTHYKQRKGLQTVLALCFTTRPETFHHWKFFADGPSGVCIEFNKDQLLRAFKTIHGVTLRAVEYE